MTPELETILKTMDALQKRVDGVSKGLEQAIGLNPEMYRTQEHTEFAKSAGTAVRSME